MLLRYLATGSFLLTVADFAGVSESSACRYVHQTYRAVALLRPKYIYFPKNAVEKRKVVNGFYDRSRFLRVIGAVDCTQIKIQLPGR